MKSMGKIHVGQYIARAKQTQSRKLVHNPIGNGDSK